MILCGASAVQIGTCHWTEGPKCFNRIYAELSNLMKSKGYTTINDFKGQLKEWSKDGVALSREAKKQKRGNQIATSSSGSSSKEISGDYQFLSMLLMVIIAILLADKLGHISI